MINFTKMHGLGNDFVVMNNLDGDVCLSVEEIRQLADRRLGIGFDQLLMIESATSKDADFRYVIFNAGGSEVSQCGNGARCFALYIQKKNFSYKNPLTVETNEGLLVLKINKKSCLKNYNCMNIIQSILYCLVINKLITFIRCVPVIATIKQMNTGRYNE